MKSQWKEVFISAMAGGLLTLVGVYLLGYSSAITMPAWAVSYHTLWNLLVVQFLGIGIAALIVSYSLSKLLGINLPIVVSVLFVSVVALTSLYQNGYYYFDWSHIFVLVMSLLLGSYLGRGGVQKT